MDDLLLKQLALDYLLAKEDIRAMTERKNTLEKSLCEMMHKNKLYTIELPDGSKLYGKVKEYFILSDHR